MRAKRIMCVNNLKQVGLAFRIWSNDNGDKFPMQVEAKKGGSLEAIKEGQVLRHFLVISNELSTPKILACPTDDHMAVKDFAELKTTNISYFVGVDADETKPSMLLSGDRNITNGLAVDKSLLELSADPLCGWTEKMHEEAGNLALADGSAQQATTIMLRRMVENAKEANKNGKTRIQLPVAGSGSE